MSSLPDSLPCGAARLLAAIIITTTALVPSMTRAQTVPLQIRSEAMALMQVCRADYDRLCPGVVPGGGRVLACLRTRANELSANCAQALPRAESLRDRATAAGALPR